MARRAGSLWSSSKRGAAARGNQQQWIAAVKPRQDQSSCRGAGGPRGAGEPKPSGAWPAVKQSRIAAKSSAEQRRQPAMPAPPWLQVGAGAHVVRLLHPTLSKPSQKWVIKTTLIRHRFEHPFLTVKTCSPALPTTTPLSSTVKSILGRLFGTSLTFAADF